MQKDVKLENAGELKEFREYSKEKLAIAKVCVLSTAPNSHGLRISEEVLRRDIGSIRGNFLVAHMMCGDAGSHDKAEVPVGYFVPNKAIEFEEVGCGEAKVVKAWAYAILSKQYAKDAYDMFVRDNHRATSIEMRVETGEDESEVLSFDAYGSTILGKAFRPSCPDAEVSLVRFAEQAKEFFEQRSDSLEALKKFAKERKQTMADGKKYKIDKSKEKLSSDDWSEVDKAALRGRVMSAKNRSELVNAVYLDVREGWEDAPSEGLKYPVMELKGNTFVYNRHALASALAYAKANDEQAVVRKVEKIYKDLGLNETDGKEEAKMEETKMFEPGTEAKMAEIEGRKAWAEIIKKVQEHEGDVYVDSVENDHIIYTKDGERYRVDADIKTGADDDAIEAEIKWDTVKKDADQKMSYEELEAETCRLKAEIEDRDNIIMNKDHEIEVLSDFKNKVLEKERAMTVEAVMADIKDFVDNSTYNEIRDEGLKCEFDAIDGWTNKAKAICFGAVKKKSQEKNTEVWSFAAPVSKQSVPEGDIWDRLRKNFETI